MTIYQILSLARPAFDVLLSQGMNLKDIQYLDLYDDYQKMLYSGEKKVYIEAVLCEKYGIKRTKYYQVIKAFKMQVG